MKDGHIIKLFITISVFLYSCLFENEQKDKPEVFIETVVSESIEVDTLLPYNHFHSVISKVHQLNLPLLNNGFDSLKIRIWYEHSLAYQKKVLILSYSSKKWKGELITYQIDEGMGKEATILSYKRQNVQPVSGWQELISELYTFNINTNIGDNRHGADGPVYSVEVASKTSYLFYDYLNVRSYDNGKEPLSDFEKIIQLINREFPKADFIIR